MKISTRGRYALRLMLDLAMNGENNVVRIKDIAERQQISDKYLEQIISVLNKAGYVRSTRGPQGGYSLRKAPEEYTVGDILRLTEGSLAPVECLANAENPCPKQQKCATIMLWEKVDKAIRDVVDHVTLQDLLDWQKQERC